MSDAWEEIQAIKVKRNSLREKLQKRKKERQDILNQSAAVGTGRYIFPKRNFTFDSFTLPFFVFFLFRFWAFLSF